MIKIHSKKGHHWFTICGKNGKVFATSECYTRRRNCLKAIEDMTSMLQMESGVPIIDAANPVKKRPKVKYSNYPDDDMNEG